MRRVLAALAACAACAAFALDTPQWPPPASVEARMRELQAVLGSREANAAQRDAAREELSSLLKSPAAPARSVPERKPPPRAAIDPFPSVVRPAEGPVPPTPGIAHIEVVVPPRHIVIPQSGAVATPSGRAAVDPRTGSVLHEAPGGYIDPRTGAFTPR